VKTEDVNLTQQNGLLKEKREVVDSMFRQRIDFFLLRSMRFIFENVYDHKFKRLQNTGVKYILNAKSRNDR